LKLKLPGKENNQFLAGINLNPKNAHRANKSYFLQVHQDLLFKVILVSSVAERHNAAFYKAIKFGFLEDNYGIFDNVLQMHRGKVENRS